MKKKIFLACTALVVSAAAVVGVKAYSSSTYSLLDANLEAIAQNESANLRFSYCLDYNNTPSDNATWEDLESSTWDEYPVCDNRTHTSSPKPDISGATTTNSYMCTDELIKGTDWHFMGTCYTRK